MHPKLYKEHQTQTKQTTSRSKFTSLNLGRVARAQRRLCREDRAEEERDEEKSAQKLGSVERKAKQRVGRKISKQANNQTNKQTNKPCRPMYHSRIYWPHVQQERLLPWKTLAKGIILEKKKKNTGTDG